MKKITIITTSVLIIASVVFYSCKKDVKNNISISNNYTYKNLKFKNQKSDLYNLKEEGGGTIVEFDEWGRKKKQCHGWGLCNAVWFPKADSSTNPIYAAPLMFDSGTNKYYIDILLSEPMPLPIPDELQNIPIDEDFIIYSHEYSGTDLIFSAGEYPFDITLGDFGGYRIYLN